MKLTTNRKDLADAARRAAGVVPRTSYTRSLTGVHLSARENLTITASDLDTTVAATIHADVGEPGDVLVPADLLARFLATVSDDRVTITTGDDDMSITCGSATGTLLALDIDAWPNLAEPDGATVTLDEDTHRAISRVLHASDPTATTSLYKTVVHLEGNRAICTDSYRLALADLGDVDLPAVNLPTAALSKILRDADGPIEATFGADASRIETADGVSWTLRHIAIEEYPPVDRIIPTSASNPVTVARAKLAEAVDRAEVFSGERRHVILAVADGVMTAKAREADVGEGVDELDCEGSIDFEVMLNGKFFGALLDAVWSDEVTLGFTSAMKPLLVVDGPLTAVLMPVRIS